MVKKCLYCEIELEDNCVVDFCERCGVGVFGTKMFRAIVENMENAKNNGDLGHTDQFKVSPRELAENPVPVESFDGFGLER